MRAHVTSNCIACGLCASLCPDIFSLSNEGYAVARDDIHADQEELVYDTARACPVNAIELD